MFDKTYRAECFYTGAFLPDVPYDDRESLRELYELLMMNGYKSVALTDIIRGVPVYRDDTEGGEFDELLYVTAEGLVLYGLIPHESGTIDRATSFPPSNCSEEVADDGR